MKKIFFYLLGLPKSIIVNFRLCKIQDAIKLPILVSHKTKLSALSGCVTFDKVKIGIVRIGFGSVETYDHRYQRTILSIKGQVHFCGKAKIGFGSRLSIDGVLNLGHNFHISAASTIICREHISIGENTLMAWESLISDSDLHAIYNKAEEKTNQNKEIIIGAHCWIGAKSSILKGVQLADNTIIALGSIVTGKWNKTETILAGNPAKVIKENMRWQE